MDCLLRIDSSCKEIHSGFPFVFSLRFPGRFPQQFWGLNCGSVMGVRRGVRIGGCREVRRGGSSSLASRGVRRWVSFGGCRGVRRGGSSWPVVGSACLASRGDPSPCA
jgi:hypothetical protein